MFRAQVKLTPNLMLEVVHLGARQQLNEMVVNEGADDAVSIRV